MARIVKTQPTEPGVGVDRAPAFVRLHSPRPRRVIGVSRKAHSQTHRPYLPWMRRLKPGSALSNRIVSFGQGSLGRAGRAVRSTVGMIAPSLICPAAARGRRPPRPRAGRRQSWRGGYGGISLKAAERTGPVAHGGEPVPGLLDGDGVHGQMTLDGQDFLADDAGVGSLVLGFQCRA